jgi:hypothetical protein
MRRGLFTMLRLMRPFNAISTRVPPPTLRRPAWLALAAAAVAVSVTAGLAPSALAESTGIATYNRPSMTEAGGTDYLAWADLTNNGSVHVGKLDSSGRAGVQWTDPGTTTYYGTGPTIASVHGVGIVVAWTSLSDHHLWVAVPQGSGGGDGGGAFCEADLTVQMDEGIGVRAEFNFPNDPTSNATPYLTSEGDDGSGSLFLTWVDYSGSYMHVTKITPPPGGCGNWMLDSNVNIYTDTSWDGPAMVVSGYGGTEDYWLMWAGKDAGNHLNIAEYDTNWNRIGNKSTEWSHSTKTDMGGAYLSASGAIFMSYCGTNDVVYYQEFTTVSGGPEVPEPGASCLPQQYSPAPKQTFWSGGVGVNYEYTTQSIRLAWADETSAIVQLASV